MRSNLLAAVLSVLVIGNGAFLGAGTAQADSATESASDIRLVIENQIDAFRRDDGVEAFSYASPSVQRRFRSADTFMQMVQTGYPQVYRPRAVEFQGLDIETGRAVQRLFFIGPDGAGALALYFMEQQRDGSWKIDGVQLRRLRDTAT
ncbi:DUF4864 domain-containing protein [Algihabitans albus]|uniref:DUF4864 domain-containing protein n=1 Tax=Algihabitans albus TaxID=2164067 RepID=UPI000E5C9B3A|nr:DUF4864 domain-containing protein [Algihabitans albus]